MNNKIAAAAVAIAMTGLFASTAMAEGPVNDYDAAVMGPKVSSHSRVSSAQPAVAVPDSAGGHYVWVEGYDPGGKWRGHWLISR